MVDDSRFCNISNACGAGFRFNAPGPQQNASYWSATLPDMATPTDTKRGHSFWFWLSWVGGAFLAVSVVAAFSTNTVTIWHFLIVAALYLIAMLYGSVIWETICGTRQKVK